MMQVEVKHNESADDTMTREKLVEELSKSEYAAKSFTFGAMNVKKIKVLSFLHNQQCIR